MILNPLPRDLALAEFDFMNCEAAMLKVCKLDINWAAEGWGTERVVFWFFFFFSAGDVTGDLAADPYSSKEAVSEILPIPKTELRVSENPGNLNLVIFGSAAASPVQGWATGCTHPASCSALYTL